MSSKRRLLYGISLNIGLLSAASLLTDISSEMILPLIPAFFLSLGGTEWLLGLAEGLAESTVSFFKMMSGYYSDKAGRRKPFVYAGYGFSSAMKAIWGFVASWPQFVAVRVSERMGKGIRDPPRDAIIAESTAPETVGKAFGFHRAMDTTGAIFGPILSIVLLSVILTGGAVMDRYRTIFMLAAIPAIAAFLITLLVREKRRQPAKMKPLLASIMYPPPALRYFIIVAAVFSLANFSYAFFLLKVKQVTGSDTLTVVFYLIFNVVYALNAFMTGALSDRLGRKPVIAVGYSLFAFLCASLVFVNDVTILVLMFAVYGLSFAFVEGTQKALISDLAEKERRGTALGAYHMTVGLAKLPAGILAGALWYELGHEYAFAYGAVVASIALVLLLGFKERRPAAADP